MSEPKRSNAILPPKCDAAEVLEQVKKWILQGNSEHDIAEAIREKWPDVKTRPVIVAVMTEVAKSAAADPRAVAGWCIEATRHLYQRMVEVGDFPGALRAVKQLADFARNPIVLDEPPEPGDKN